MEWHSSLTDSSGKSSFDSVSLHSPYVLMEMSPLQLELEFLGPELSLKVKCTSGDWSATAFRTMQEEILRTEGTMTDDYGGFRCPSVASRTNSDFGG